MLELALKCCFRLLEKDLGTTGENQVQTHTVAHLIRIIARSYVFWDASDLFTPAQIDLLVDRHLHHCKGTEGSEGYSDAIWDTFEMLASLHGSPSTPDRRRSYIDTIIHFMGQIFIRVAALREAWSIRSGIASMGQDNKFPRERFSKALASAVLSDTMQTIKT